MSVKRNPLKNRDRGKAYERKAAEFMASLTGESWRRTAQNRGVGGVADIEPCDPQSKWSFLHVEVKSGLAVKFGSQALRDAISQAERDRSKDSVLLVLWFMPRMGWAATASLEGVPVSMYGPDDIFAVLRAVKEEREAA